MASTLCPPRSTAVTDSVTPAGAGSVEPGPDTGDGPAEDESPPQLQTPTAAAATIAAVASLMPTVIIVEGLALAYRGVRPAWLMWMMPRRSASAMAAVDRGP